MKTALTIAGSDSSGGAGIQADIKTMMANGVYAMSAITALTAQNTTGVTAIQNATAEFLGQELDCIFTDIFPDAVKIGMVSESDLIRMIAKKLRQYQAKNIVVDPVMVATSGAKLLQDDALHALRTRLIPLASIITPNIPEAELLTGMRILDAAAADRAILSLRRMGSPAVLLKGGHLDEGECVIDRYDDGHADATFMHDRLPIEGHGTGCTLASAIAANLCRGMAMPAAVEAATDYIERALRGGYRPGRGDVVVLDHFGASALRTA